MLLVYARRLVTSRKFILVLVSTCLLALAFTIRVLADAAPPYQPPGSNISPNGQTQVQMLAETVVINVQSLHSCEDNVRVSADFTMHNLGTVDEHMQVRFPLENPSGEGDGYGGSPQVENFAVKVNGRSVSTTTLDQPSLPGDLLIKWAGFEVDFPVNKDVKIDVTYQTAPTSDCETSAQINYILETGAGWRGPIGSADIILQLPYAADPASVNSDSATYDTTTGAKFIGNELHWHWEYLEPTRNDNFFVTIVFPDTWKKILDLRTTSKAKPKDAHTAIALAEAYKAAGSEKHGFVGNEQLADLSQQVIEHAIALNSDSADLHAELASILLWRYLPQEVNQLDPVIQRIVVETNHALKLDPNNELAGNVLQEMQRWAPQATNTPSPSATSTVHIPTGTNVPTTVKIPATLTTLDVSTTPRPTSSSNVDNGGAVLLLVIVAIIIVAWVAIRPKVKR